MNTTKEELQALAKAKAQDVAWASGLKVEDILLRALELRSVYRLRAEEDRRAGLEASARDHELKALGLLSLIEGFWANPQGEGFSPSDAQYLVLQADKALLRAHCIERGVPEWLKDEWE